MFSMCHAGSWRKDQFERRPLWDGKQRRNTYACVRKSIGKTSGSDGAVN